MAIRDRIAESIFEMPWWTPKTLQQEELEKQQRREAREAQEAAYNTYKSTHPPTAPPTIPTPPIPLSTSKSTTSNFLDIRRAVETATNTDYRRHHHHPRVEPTIVQRVPNTNPEEKHEKVLMCGVSKRLLIICGLVFCALLVGVVPTIFFSLRRVEIHEVIENDDGSESVVVASDVTDRHTLLFSDLNNSSGIKLGNWYLKIEPNMEGHYSGGIYEICRSVLEVHLSVEYDGEKGKYMVVLDPWGLEPVDLVFMPSSGGCMRAEWVTKNTGAVECILVETIELMIDENDSQVFIEQEFGSDYDCLGSGTNRKAGDLREYGCSWKGRIS